MRVPLCDFLLAQALAGAWAGLTADRLIFERGWRVKTVRQIMQTAGMLGPAICLGAAVFEPQADISWVLYMYTCRSYRERSGRAWGGGGGGAHLLLA